MASFLSTVQLSSLGEFKIKEVFTAPCAQRAVETSSGMFPEDMWSRPRAHLFVGSECGNSRPCSTSETLCRHRRVSERMRTTPALNDRQKQRWSVGIRTSQLILLSSASSEDVHSFGRLVLLTVCHVSRGQSPAVVASADPSRAPGPLPPSSAIRGHSFSFLGSANLVLTGGTVQTPGPTQGGCTY